MTSSSRLSDPESRIRVSLFSANGLAKRDILGLPDPFAVLTVDGEQKNKTAIVRKTLNPVWNEHLDVLVRDSSMIVIQVFDHRRFKKRDEGFLGVINISAAEATTAAANCTGHGDTITRDLTMSSNNLPVNGKFVFGFSFINQFPPSSPASAEPVSSPSGFSLTLVSASELASRPSSSNSTNLAAPTVSALDPRPSEPMQLSPNRRARGRQGR